jgi:hypothetical protein
MRLTAGATATYVALSGVRGRLPFGLNPTGLWTFIPPASSLMRALSGLSSRRLSTRVTLSLPGARVASLRRTIALKSN